MVEYNILEYSSSSLLKIHTSFHAWTNLIIINDFANTKKDGEPAEGCFCLNKSVHETFPKAEMLKEKLWNFLVL